MRVVVSARAESVSWLPRQVDIYAGQLIAEALSEKLVLSVTEQGYNRLVQEARELNAPPQVRARIGDLVHRVPITANRGRPPVDLFVDEISAKDSGLLLDLLVHDEFLRLSDQRRSSVMSGESRQEVFDRHLLVYGSAATSVVCLDQYALGNIDAGRGDGLVWLCQEFVKLGVSRLVIISCLPPSKSLERSIARFKSELRRPLALEMRGESVEISLVAADHNPTPKRSGGDGSLVHDRHMRFLIGSDRGRFTPTFDIGPGFDAFNRAEMLESFTLAEVPDRRAAINRENQISRKARQSTQTFELA